ncbi:MAG: integrase core domain-containing protein, partial [Myxococcota bacterium]
MLGIKHQRTLLQAPWQNGRIERFFGTLKSALKLRSDGPVDADDLRSFRAWYNHVRPHQHLNGQTPAEAWEGSKKRLSQ